jgi:tRNA 2-thiouridine synthesizing protein A
MGDNEESADYVIDARGLACPLPVLRLRKALQGRAPGTIAELLATDPATRRDVPSFCVSAGHRLLTAVETAGQIRFRIEAGGGA